MKINWILRLKNKSTLTALIALMVAFVYQLLGLLEIVPPISHEEATQFFGILINILATIGVLVDPTTKGASDSAKALAYVDLE